MCGGGEQMVKYQKGKKRKKMMRMATRKEVTLCHKENYIPDNSR